MDVGLVVGRSRLVLFGGLLAMAVGLFAGVTPMAWVGVALVAVAFGANTVAKVQHYRDLPIDAHARTKLVSTWVFFATFAVALVVDAVASRVVGGYEGYFWLFAAMALLLGGAYWIFQIRYLPEELRVDGENTG